MNNEKALELKQRLLDSSKMPFQKPLETVQFKYRLLIKCHLNTGINYLCVSQRRNYISYKGSGKIWKSLINAHSSTIHTRVLYRSNDLEDFNKTCLFYSEMFDVVKSPEFANLIPEFGYSNKNVSTYMSNLAKENPEQLVQSGKRLGQFAKNNKIGIFDPNLQDQRTNWAKIGAEALNAKGTRSGIYCKSWRDNHKEQTFENCSKGGKIGGKITGSMYWWNNGVKNTKSYECPGPEWVRGQLMSEKKRKAFEEMKNQIKGTNKDG